MATIAEEVIPADRRATLVVLAAGKSTRFGSPKQLEPVGPNGETVLEVTMRDARAAGCQEVRLVVRPEHLALFKSRLGHLRNVSIVVQREALGTAHAAWTGMLGAAGTSIVVNGDDLYGAASLLNAIEHARNGASQEHALVAFRLGNTLSPNGPVNRAVCHAEGDMLLDTQEVVGLVESAAGEASDAAGQRWPATTLVSMNLWVFRESMMEVMEAHWRERPANPIAETGLPDLVRAAMASGHRFRLLSSPERWCGLTFAGDAELVRRFLSTRQQ